MAKKSSRRSGGAKAAGPNILIISGSLNPDSRSRVLAEEARRALRAGGARVRLINLRDHPLPLCDGAAAYGDPGLPALSRAIERAGAILIAVPIYNFDYNAAVKNLVELTGRAWKGKIVGFICAAGGKSDYMSPMVLANSLMLDFRCLIIPRFVYATGQDFDDDEIPTEEIRERVAELAGETVRLAVALAD